MVMTTASSALKHLRQVRLPALRFGNFFKYHGLLAPGVRLLRLLPFGMKAAVVTLCFVVPIALLGVNYLRTITGQMALTRGERQGLVIAIQAAALSHALHAAELDAAVTALGGAGGLRSDWRARVDQAYLELSEAVATLPYAPAIIDSLRRVQTPHEALKAGDAVDAKGLLESLHRYQDALNALVPVLTAESGLAVDPVLATHRLQHLAFTDLPALAGSLASVRAKGAGWLGGRTEPHWRNGAVGNLMLAELALDQVRYRTEPLARERAPGASHLHDAATWKPIVDFIATANNGLLGAAPLGEVSSFLAEGELAVQAAQTLHRMSLEALDKMLADRDETLRQEALRMAVLVGVCLVAALYMLFSVYRVMDGGLDLIREQVTRMAQGDLSARPRARGRDEVAKALDSLSESLSRLADLFSAVRQGVSAMSHASHSMTTASDDLRRRTEETSHSTTEIIGRVAQFVDQLEDTGRRIDDAMQVVQTLRIDALRSHTQMQRLDDRMKSLRGKSRQIADIVQVIDAIAFRTNILSLNAAVEAAKAGPAGRGFAVVAQEVRSLAKRTADSARQVHGIITSSTEDIEQCSAMADMSAESLADTQRNVLRINQSMDEIVGLTRGGLGSSQALLQQLQAIDGKSIDNHKLVEQMAAATDNLRDQGVLLSEKVTGFKLT